MARPMSALRDTFGGGLRDARSLFHFAAFSSFSFLTSARSFLKSPAGKRRRNLASAGENI